MRISILGSGNIANYFGKILFDKGVEIVNVFSTNPSSANLLCSQIQATFCSTIQEMDSNIDAVLLAVPDDALESIAIPFDTVVIHHSGNYPTHQLAAKYNNSACLWPLYSINSKTIASENQFPICMNASNDHSYTIAKELASHISEMVIEVKDEQKQSLHLAATIGNNFSNYILGFAQQICKEQQLPFSLLQPILLQTVQQLQHRDAFETQTGPARRNDTSTIEKHLHLLQKNTEAASVYQMITERIQQKYS
jgi:predicted short-subunit dehydrogenase-like oxidoreductase (DUF2520 family)